MNYSLKVISRDFSPKKRNKKHCYIIFFNGRGVTSFVNLPPYMDEPLTMKIMKSDVTIDNALEVELTAKEKHANMLGKILTQREKRVISLRFGFNTRNALTLDQVGKSMGLTRERIRQIETKALNKLRSHPRLKFMNDYLN